MQFSPASGSLGEEAQLRDWQRPKYKWGLDVDNYLFPSDHGKITNKSLLCSLYGRRTIFVPIILRNFKEN